MPQPSARPSHVDLTAALYEIDRTRLTSAGGIAAQLKMPAGEFYLGLRLDRAQKLLRQTSLPVTEIAIATGFVSPSHFSRAYRKCFGRAPRER